MDVRVNLLYHYDWRICIYYCIRGCKDVNMNQKSLRIVLVSVVLFLADIKLHGLPIKRIRYKLFVVTYTKKNCLTIKSTNITINRYARTNVSASLSTLITLAYIGALTLSFIKSVTLTVFESSRILCALTQVEILKKNDFTRDSEADALNWLWIESITTLVIPVTRVISVNSSNGDQSHAWWLESGQPRYS